MCRYIASVVAHLTRVRPEAEGASDQDRPGPGRIPAIPPHHSPQCAHALSGSVGRVTPMTITGRMPVLVCRCVKVGGAVPARSAHRRPAANAAARRPGGEAVMPNPVYLEPQAKAVADANANPPYVFELGPVKTLPVDIGDTTVPGGPSGRVSVRILRPHGASRPLPVIVYLHGPGWVFGNTQTHDRLIRELAVGAQAAVVFPNYSLSPEAKYPTAIQECHAVAKWVAEHGQERGLDGSRIAIAGDGVGGNMSAAVTLLAKQRGGPAFRQQVLFYPVTDATFATEFYHQFATGYYLRRDGMQWYWDQYTTDPAQRAEPTASPLRASLEQLAGLPPALVITGEDDVLRDEGEAYADKLREAGVPVTADRFQAIIHDFVMLNALADTSAARSAITLATDTLRKVLSDNN